MGKKLAPPDLALYQAVDEVLHYIWDPIGISSVPQARDEYHGYLPVIFGLVHQGTDAEAIAKHLSQITTERMGLAENYSHDLEVAQTLIEWRSAVSEKFA